MSTFFFPFRPALYGLFSTRFYDKVKQLTDNQLSLNEVELIVESEVNWVTQDCSVNPRQRKVYRTTWLLLRDIIRAGWSYRWNSGMIELRPPSFEEVNKPDEIKKVKASIRDCMYEARKEKIVEAAEFISRMEKPLPSPTTKVPITALIANGAQLAEELRTIVDMADEEQTEAISNVIKPYLQLVRENERDKHTGHKLSDIWRYFRFTWSTPSENTPGRTMQYLIRDAAREYHPIIGIASLENSPVKIACRDHYLGFSLESFQDEITETRSIKDIHKAFERLLSHIEAAIYDICIDGLCSTEEIQNPSEIVVRRLLTIAARSAEKREEALRDWEENSEGLERGLLGNISMDAEDALYRRKRAEQLAKLLLAKRTIKGLVEDPDFNQKYARFMMSESGQIAIRTALTAIKSKHIGTSMLELNVCGAIPPYNSLLGGKLVALMMLSPQVINDYRERYGNRPSDIASRLKGEPVIRPAELVFIGTTSLYYVGSSQYNRLRLPPGLFNSNSAEVRWEKLGTTMGYGTLHISRLTLRCLQEVGSVKGFKDVNNVFGEGSSPKLRIIRQGLESILEPGQRLAIEQLSKHAMPRIVFGAWLTRNGKEYFFNRNSTPKYYFGASKNSVKGTEKIVAYWQKRWLLMRIKQTEIINEIQRFCSDTLLVSNHLRDDEGLKFEPIEEGCTVPEIERGEL
jgi:hypothetical protein